MCGAVLTGAYCGDAASSIQSHLCFGEGSPARVFSLISSAQLMLITSKLAVVRRSTVH